MTVRNQSIDYFNVFETLTFFIVNVEIIFVDPKIAKNGNSRLFFELNRDKSTKL